MIHCNHKNIIFANPSAQSRSGKGTENRFSNINTPERASKQARPRGPKRNGAAIVHDCMVGGTQFSLFVCVGH